MQIIKWLKKKSENKFEELNKFYKSFDKPVPSLQVYLFRKYPNKRWFTFTIIHGFDIALILLYFFTLWYASFVNGQCNLEVHNLKSFLNGNCTDFTCSSFSYNLSRFNGSMVIIK